MTLPFELDGHAHEDAERLKQDDTPTKPSPVIPKFDNGYRTVKTDSAEHKAFLAAGYVPVEHDDVHTILVRNRRHTVRGERRRTADKFHQDQVRDAANLARLYGVDLGPMGDEVILRVLLCAQAWRDREDAKERQHVALRDRVDALKAGSR